MLSSPGKTYGRLRAHPYFSPQALSSRVRNIIGYSLFPICSNVENSPLIDPIPINLESVSPSPSDKPKAPPTPIFPPPRKRWAHHHTESAKEPKPFPLPKYTNAAQALPRPPRKFSIHPQGVHKRVRPRKHASRGHRLQVDRGQLTELDPKIRETLKINVIDAETSIFLEQMASLSRQRAFRVNLYAARETIQRAEEQTPERLRKQVERAAAAEKLRIEEARAVEEKRRREARRQEALRAMADRRRDEVRKEEARRAMAARRLDEVRKEEARQRRLREMEEAARLADMRQRHEQEEQERRRREEDLRRAHAVRDTRAARPLLEKALDDHFALYDGKWLELKAGGPMRPLFFVDLPWPILDVLATSPEDITPLRLREFVLHPMRRTMVGKSHRDRIRIEMLRWHPDKFDSKVLSKIVEAERTAVKHAAEAVVRILTQMLGE